MIPLTDTDVLYDPPAEPEHCDADDELVHLLVKTLDGAVTVSPDHRVQLRAHDGYGGNFFADFQAADANEARRKREQALHVLFELLRQFHAAASGQPFDDPTDEHQAQFPTGPVVTYRDARRAAGRD